MFHFQKTGEGWKEAVRALPPNSSVKAVDAGDILRDAAKEKPGIHTAFRHWGDPMQHYTGKPSSGWFDWSVAKDLARAWFNTHIDGTFVDKYAAYVDAVSWHNEIWANSQNITEKNERIEATRAALFVWNNEFRPMLQTRVDKDICLIVGEAAVGNDMPSAVAKLSIEEDALLGYHPYSWWGNTGSGQYSRAANDWVDLSGRWAIMEQRWGLKPKWIFTEAGPFEAAETGWRHSACLGNSTGRYVQAVREWLWDVQGTAAYKEGRIKGFHLFTSGGGSQWKHFETKQPEMNILAAMIAEEWKPGSHHPPPPPPPPPPEPRLLNSSFEDGWTNQSDRAQEPKDWNLTIYTDGEVRGRPINGTPECVHKYGPDPKYDDVTLPEDEWLGGENALVLHGTTCYKIFGQSTWKAKLDQTVSGYKPGEQVTLIVPVNIHFDGRGDIYDVDDTMLEVVTSVALVELLMTKELDRKWQYIEAAGVADANGDMLVVIRPSVKYEHKTAFFFDNILVKPASPDPDTFEELAWEVTSQMQRTGDGGIRLNKEAGIQKQINIDNEADLNLQIVTTEVWVDGKAVQAVESLTGRVPRRVYVWEPGKSIYYFEEPEESEVKKPFLGWPLNRAKQTEFMSWAIFGAPREYEGDHEGLDLHAVLGEAVQACLEGTVVWASDQRRSGGDSMYGKHVIIEHVDGWITWYAHLDAISVVPGLLVRRGETIGAAGSSGNSTGPHLHLTVQHIGHGESGYVVPDAVDPLNYLLYTNTSIVHDIFSIAQSDL